MLDQQNMSEIKSKSVQIRSLVNFMILNFACQKIPPKLKFLGDLPQITRVLDLTRKFFYLLDSNSLEMNFRYSNSLGTRKFGTRPSTNVYKGVQVQVIEVTLPF